MAAGERKRPWYLVVSLLAALAFGASGARSGWNKIVLYREPIDSSTFGQGIADEADRAAVVARVDDYVHTLDAAKSRGWPLGIATLLLGGATLFFAVRAMGGNGGARAALVQLVLAQAGLSGANHWLLRDVDEAELRMYEAVLKTRDTEVHERVLKSQPDDMSRVAVQMLRAASPIGLALHVLGSALIVVALTRRRSRDFFESAAAAVGGR
jgi:hypothetical protein